MSFHELAESSELDVEEPSTIRVHLDENEPPLHEEGAEKNAQTDLLLEASSQQSDLPTPHQSTTPLVQEAEAEAEVEVEAEAKAEAKAEAEEVTSISSTVTASSLPVTVVESKEQEQEQEAEQVHAVENTSVHEHSTPFEDETKEDEKEHIRSDEPLDDRPSSASVSASSSSSSSTSSSTSTSHSHTSSMSSSSAYSESGSSTPQWSNALGLYPEQIHHSTLQRPASTSISQASTPSALIQRLRHALTSYDFVPALLQVAALLKKSQQATLTMVQAGDYSKEKSTPYSALRSVLLRDGLLSLTLRALSDYGSDTNVRRAACTVLTLLRSPSHAQLGPVIDAMRVAPEDPISAQQAIFIIQMWLDRRERAKKHSMLDIHNKHSNDHTSSEDSKQGTTATTTSMTTNEQTNQLHGRTRDGMMSTLVQLSVTDAALLDLTIYDQEDDEFLEEENSENEEDDEEEVHHDADSDDELEAERFRTEREKQEGEDELRRRQAEREAREKAKQHQQPSSAEGATQENERRSISSVSSSVNSSAVSASSSCAPTSSTALPHDASDHSDSEDEDDQERAEGVTHEQTEVEVNQNKSSSVHIEEIHSDEEEGKDKKKIEAGASSSTSSDSNPVLQTEQTPSASETVSATVDSSAASNTSAASNSSLSSAPSTAKPLKSALKQPKEQPGKGVEDKPAKANNEADSLISLAESAPATSGEEVTSPEEEANSEGIYEDELSSSSSEEDEEDDKPQQGKKTGGVRFAGNGKSSGSSAGAGVFRGTKAAGAGAGASPAAKKTSFGASGGDIELSARRGVNFDARQLGEEEVDGVAALEARARARSHDPSSRTFKTAAGLRTTSKTGAVHPDEIDSETVRRARRRSLRARDAAGAYLLPVLAQCMFQNPQAILLQIRAARLISTLCHFRIELCTPMARCGADKLVLRAMKLHTTSALMQARGLDAIRWLSGPQAGITSTPHLYHVTHLVRAGALRRMFVALATHPHDKAVVRCALLALDAFMSDQLMDQVKKENGLDGIMRALKATLEVYRYDMAVQHAQAHSQTLKQESLQIVVSDNTTQPENTSSAHTTTNPPTSSASSSPRTKLDFTFLDLLLKHIEWLSRMEYHRNLMANSDLIALLFETIEIVLRASTHTAVLNFFLTPGHGSNATVATSSSSAASAVPTFVNGPSRAKLRRSLYTQCQSCLSRCLRLLASLLKVEGVLGRFLHLDDSLTSNTAKSQHEQQAHKEKHDLLRQHILILLECLSPEEDVPGRVWKNALLILQLIASFAIGAPGASTASSNAQAVPLGRIRLNEAGAMSILRALAAEYKEIDDKYYASVSKLIQTLQQSTSSNKCIIQ